MMKRILFATDLDNTLLFSHRHRQPGDRCAELWNGAEQGFFTPETVDLLPQAARQVRLLPITTRSIAQYQRIRWPAGALPREALTANGAVLLRGGEIDRDWYDQSWELVRAHQGALRDLLGRISAREDVTSARIVENMYVYAACSDAAAAERCAAAWAQDAPFQMEVSGRKVYWFPPGIDKGTALRRAAGRYRPERILCAGDSVIDVPMLRRADLAMIPDGTLLPALPAERTLVCQENVRFPDFVLRTVLAQAGPG